MAKKDDPLAEYNAKRDFTRTKEPAGKAGKSGKDRIFMVQKHDATRLHWDLRLEADGVLKSWAVTKGPSPDPDIKRSRCGPKIIRWITRPSRAPSRRTNMVAAR